MKIKLLAEYSQVNKNIDIEMEKGLGLAQLGDYMKFAHALLQAQALIDLLQRAAALLGDLPRSYGEVLARREVISKEEVKFYKSVVGLRNVLVHNYLGADIGVVEAMLRQRLYRRVAELAVKVAERVGDP
ncbi:MAG: HepT-like ribonuclease domain-containing protein [Pyrobaculum sp.]